MHEEDRKTALDMYGKLFEEAADEQALIHMLLSPTRQAVVMARSYDAAGRRMDLERQAEDEDGLPAFIVAIDSIYQSAAAKGLLREEEAGTAVLENQVSLFDDVEDLFAEAEPEEKLPEQIEAAEEEELSEEEDVPEEDAAPAEEETPEEVTAEPVDEVDAFLAEFSIDEEVLVAETAKEEEPEAEPAEISEQEMAEELPVSAEDEQPETGTVRKARVGLLILYLIFAIPLTAAGVVLLLVPTLLVLAMAALVITGGVAALLAAFSGFAVLADILIVLGAALIILALGLLLLWLFVWLVGGAVVGLIHGAISLGGKWCYKEVPAV